MERDFMGLSSKQPLGVVAEEPNNDGIRETGFGRAPASPNFMNRGVGQADNFKKIGSAYPVSFIPNMGDSQAGLETNAKLLGGIPAATTSHALPSFGCFGGAFEPWNGMTAGKSPTAQLTIFYAGTVNVFDDFPPEKAQALMLMAANLSLKPPLPAKPLLQVQEQAGLKPIVADNPSPLLSSGIPSPISVTSRPVAQPAGESLGMPDPMAEKLGFNYAASMIPSIPQARKASLARFLEKRKERLMNAAPYNMGMKPLKGEMEDSCGMSFSATSAA